MMIETQHCIKFHAFYKTVNSIQQFIKYIDLMCGVNNASFITSSVDPGAQKFEIYARYESDIMCMSDALDKHTPKSIRITQ
jgi:hypothetical protein